MLNKKLRDEEDLFAFGDGHKKKDKGKKGGKVASKVSLPIGCPAHIARMGHDTKAFSRTFAEPRS
jgi:hypothetical protein